MSTVNDNVATEDLNAPKRIFTEEETCRNAANVLRKMGFVDAAIILEMNLNGADDEERAWISMTLSEVMNTTVNGRLAVNGWVRDAMRTVKNRAVEPKAKMLLGWLIQNTADAIAMLESIASVPNAVKQIKIQKARELLEKVHFPGYVLGCIDWMAMRAKEGENYISKLIASYPEMAEVPNMETGRANRIIEIIRQPAEEAIRKVHIHLGPMRTGKTERDRDKDQDDRKALRAARDAQYRANMKGANPPVDKHGKNKRK